MLQELSKEKDIYANFIEGMGCTGGCVGGPRTNIDADTATKVVNEYAEDSLIKTPFDTLNVMKMLKQMGVNTIDEVMHNERTSKLLTR